MVTIILYNKKLMLIKKIISPVARHAPSFKKKETTFIGHGIKGLFG